MERAAQAVSKSPSRPFLREQPRPLFHSRDLPGLPSQGPGQGTGGGSGHTLPAYLEESTDFSELGLGSKEAEGQDRANMLRYGVEVGNEAVGHLWGQQG